jgi:hypothetical protein
MVTGSGVPEVPDDGDAAQPVMVKVNEGAPVSAVTLMVKVAEAACTGSEGKANKMASTPAVASRTPRLLGSKRLSRLPYTSSAVYLVLRMRTYLIEQTLPFHLICSGETPVTSPPCSPPRLIVGVHNAVTRRTYRT